MFSDFRSRCTTGGVRLWRKATPSQICSASLACCPRSRGLRALWSRWCSEPPGMNSVTMHRLGGCRHAPTKLTSRGWSRFRRAATSFSSSSSCRGEMLSLSSQKSFLMATSAPLKLPRYTAPKPPVPRHSFCVSALNSICSCLSSLSLCWPPGAGPLLPPPCAAGFACAGGSVGVEVVHSRLSGAAGASAGAAAGAAVSVAAASEGIASGGLRRPGDSAGAARAGSAARR
mmetsp:Transcript_20002/g.63415  ORF Transcript_20002/g.63415 Transcript_20002/m.63415 type:complete len:230 (-) Transcript_20002:1584-2273(-)